MQLVALDVDPEQRLPLVQPHRTFSKRGGAATKSTDVAMLTTRYPLSIILIRKPHASPVVAIGDVAWNSRIRSCPPEVEVNGQRSFLSVALG